MAGRPAALNRWNQQRGTWRARHFDQGVLDAANAEATASVERQKAPERIAHPVIEPKAGTRFRVVRLYRREGHLCHEDIGACFTLDAATDIVNREKWRAQVWDQLDRVKADNWNDMERR